MRHRAAREPHLSLRSSFPYAYNANAQIAAITYPGRSGLLSKVAYQPFGAVASWLRPTAHSIAVPSIRTAHRRLALPSGDNIALTYDAASRITAIAESGLPGKTFGYDAVNRIVYYTNGVTTQNYAYDASGNRTGFAQQVLPAASTALTYNYDKASNRLLSIGGSGTENFTYDANGNMLSHGSPFGDYSFTYDARNRRVITYLGAIPTIDTINGLGQRTAQVVGRHAAFRGRQALRLRRSRPSDRQLQ